MSKPDIDSDVILPKLIGVEDIISRTKLSRTTIYEYIKRNELKPLKFGKLTKFVADDVEAWIKSKYRQAA